MKKELGITIFIGILIGFGLSAFFWLRNNKGTVSDLANSQPSPAPTKAEQAVNEPNESEKDISLNIIQPENEIISSQENIILNGKTQVNATVIVIWEEGQEILVADENGEFQTEINLIGGENIINISAYDNQGNKATQTLTVTYSTAKF